MKRVLATIAALVLGLTLVGCEAEEEVDEGQPETSEQAEAGEEGERQEEDAEEEGPRIAETQAIPDDELGVLPEGIGIEAGSAISDIKVAAAGGDNEVNLRELAAEQPVLVIFYRGGWCPFCNFQIRDLTTSYDRFEERNVVPVAISVDKMDEALKTEEAYEIPFPVLSDPDLQAHREFNVVYQAEPEEAERLAEMGMDLEAASGRDHHSYAVPATFLISTDGEVLWAHANLDYRLRPTIDQLMMVLDDKL